MTIYIVMYQYFENVSICSVWSTKALADHEADVLFRKRKSSRDYACRYGNPYYVIEQEVKG